MNKNNIKIYDFIEQYCYIKDKKTSLSHPIKLSKTQKEFITKLEKIPSNTIKLYGRTI